MLIHRANANRNVFEMRLELLIALILGAHILGLWAHSRAAGSSPVTTTWLDGKALELLNAGPRTPNMCLTQKSSMY